MPLLPEPIGIYVQFHNHWIQLVVLKPECKLYQLNKQPVASMAINPGHEKGKMSWIRRRSMHPHIQSIHLLQLIALI